MEVEVYRFVRLNFQKKGSHTEVYQFAWLSLQKEFGAEMRACRCCRLSTRKTFKRKCTGLPGLISKQELTWKYTGLSDMTSEQKFIGRAYMDCLLDSWKGVEGHGFHKE